MGNFDGKDWSEPVLNAIRDCLTAEKKNYEMLDALVRFATNLVESERADLNPQWMADILPYVDRDTAVEIVNYLSERADGLSGDKRFFIIEYVSRITSKLGYPINVPNTRYDERDPYREFVEQQVKSFRNWTDLLASSEGGDG